jgi:hypothetical protein
MAEGQIVRAHAIMNLQYPQPDLKVKGKEFRQYYEPLLKLNQLLVEKMLHGSTTLADPKHPGGIHSMIHISWQRPVTWFIANGERM